MASESSTLRTRTVCFIWGLALVSVRSTPSIDVSPNSFSETFVFGSDTTNSSVYLTCRVSNLGNGQKVAWFKNDRQISENGVLLESDLIDPQRYSLIGNPKYNLYIASLPYQHAFQDSGRYQCRVLTADGSLVVASKGIEVNVSVIPRDQYPVCNQFVGGREYRGDRSEYFKGDSVTMQCLSDPGKPAVVFMWFRNDFVTLLNTGAYTDNDLSFYQSLNFTLDLSTEETGTKFICQLTQTGQMNRNCTIGPITIYDELTINIYPEVTQVNSTNQAVTFTCNVEKGDPKVINYLWKVEKEGNHSLIPHSQFFNLSDNNTIEFSAFQTSDSGEYNITCVVDYGFSSRDKIARLIVKIPSTPPTTTHKSLTTSMLTHQTQNPPTSISVLSTAQKQTLDITSPSSDHAETTVRSSSSIGNANTSVIIIASTVGGLGFLLLLTIVILAVCISKSRKTNQPTRNAEIVLNQHIEVNVIAHPSQENQTLHLRESIAYDSVDDQGESKNIYVEDNIAYESTQNTRNDESADDGRQVQTLQSLENIAYESADDHGQDQSPYSRDNIAYEGVDYSDNNRNSTFPENSAFNRADDPGNHQTSHLLENVAYESVDNHGKDQTTHSCENIAYESADDMVNNRNSNFRENTAIEGAGVQGNDHIYSVDNMAYESVDTHNEDQNQYLRENETHKTADGFVDDRNANLRDNIAYESADNISAKDTAYAEGNLYETLEKKVSPTPDGNKEDGNKNVDRQVGSNNDGGQLREVGGQESASGRQLTTDRSSVAGNTTNKTLDEMYAKPNKKRPYYSSVDEI